ncbi:hypothetical protein GDO86_011472 [Hymenochirus boettgeri]|uniref:Polycystin domain-containing protein n=1 Tax=Hymenochirus boettgeri TaxID=247094 RepID=A0A8T2JJA4_9PIPI|nr:hypothetical protein GDO86_011472 [Hymenochirus boettgeri]
MLMLLPSANNVSVDIVMTLQTEAFSAMLRAQNQRWIDRKIKAFNVLFTLYNPPTNIFTIVSFLTEFSASGSIITSSSTESFTIYRTTTVVDYFIMALKVSYIK